MALIAPSSAHAATSADAAKHRAAAQTARTRAAQQQALAKQLKAQTEKLDKLVESLQRDANALDPAIYDAEARTKAVLAQITKLRSRIASQSAAIDQTAAELREQQGLLGKRAKESYKQGEWYYLDVLLGAQDFRDLFARTELLARLLSANSRVAEQLDKTRTSYEQQKAELERSMTDLTAKRQEAQTVEKRLKGLQDERQDKVDAQQSVLNQKSELMAESAKNAKRLLAIAQAEEAASARIEAELARRKGSGKYHGGMAWPVPGFSSISSPYGWRTHPVLHRRIFHAGIDIAGSGINGAAIVAAGSGTVIAAGSRGGYGNTVMIDHGNGVVTVYAHQQSGGIRVSVGQRVSKGQRIGTVGSTGMSTGPHCHFEVRVNGSAANPMNYL
jgi:murein DD-endopeptidase MepM/ murein hydrolase activator NlpD